MLDDSAWPSPGALKEVQHLAGPSALIRSVKRLEGGQHSDTWKVETEEPASVVVVREFPPGDKAASSEQSVLRCLDGLSGLAPLSLAVDLTRRWSQRPASLISWLNGRADITPADPLTWARELGRGLAVVHSVRADRLSILPSVFCDRGSVNRLSGPLTQRVRSRWSTIAEAPVVLTHCDFWSGNVAWNDGALIGIVDWSGASRGPRGYDVGWCRLDIVLLFDLAVADAFLEEYEHALGSAMGQIELWDCWAVAHSEENVATWGPNYALLGRPDLDEHELRHHHLRWTQHLLDTHGTT